MPVNLNNATAQQLQTWGKQNSGKDVYLSDRGNTGTSTLKGRSLHRIGKKRRAETKGQLLLWAQKKLGGDIFKAKKLAQGLFDISSDNQVTGQQVASFAKRVAKESKSQSVQLDAKKPVKLQKSQSSQVDENKPVKLQTSQSSQVDAKKQVKLQQSQSFQVDSKKKARFDQINQTKLHALPQKGRHQVMVGMGQGAIGKLNQMQFYTDSLQSCYAVVIRNSQTGMGGIFHVPSHHTQFDPDAELSR